MKITKDRALGALHSIQVCTHPDDVDANANIEILKQFIERQDILLRGIVNHWNEFGPENGLDELMDSAYRFLKLG